MVPELDLREFLRRSVLFGVLLEEDRQALLRRAARRRVSAGEDLFQAGDRCEEVMVLLRGRVRLWRLARDGHVLVLRLCPAGEILGQMSALEEGVHSVNATADQASQLLGIRASDFRVLLERRPAATLRLAQLLAQRVRELSEELEAMKFSSIGERLVRRLQELAKGRREIRLTHQGLAEQVGSTRENVTRVLGMLQERGILQLRRGAIEVLAHDRLDGLCRDPGDLLAGKARPGDPRARSSRA